MGFSPYSQKWLTLLAHCLATFSNAIGFGIFFSNVSTFAAYYNVDPNTIYNSFFISLACEIIFCIPVIKVI